MPSGTNRRSHCIACRLAAAHQRYNRAMRTKSFSLSPTGARKESPAKRRLLEAVARLLKEHHPGEISTSMVLDEAKVARNTLYLHFENLAALLEASLLSIFLDGVRRHVSMLESALPLSATQEDFLSHVVEIIKVSQSEDRRSFRIARCRLVAHAEKNARFSKVLATEQTLINERFIQVFTDLQKRGWLNSDITPEVAAVLVQAISLGRVVDDIASKQLDGLAWNRAYFSIVKRVVLSG